MPVYLGCEAVTEEERGNFTICYMGNVNIEPTLVSPVAMDIVTPAWPYELHFSADTCGERSEIPAWTITDLKYSQAAQSGGGSSPVNAGLSFKMRNLANFEDLNCSLHVDDTLLERTRGEPWVDCSGTSASGNFLSTKVLFNRQYNMLAINQTWMCGDNSQSRDGQ